MRLVRKITYRPLVGSSAKLVPVKPVCPTVSRGRGRRCSRCRTPAGKTTGPGPAPCRGCGCAWPAPPWQGRDSACRPAAGRGGRASAKTGPDRPYCQTRPRCPPRRPESARFHRAPRPAAAPVVLHLGGGDVAVLGQIAGIAHLEGPEDLLHGQLIQSHSVEALQQLPQQNEPRAAVAYPRARRGGQRRVEDRFGAVFRLVRQFPQVQSRGKARRVRQDLGNGDVALVRRRIQKRAQPVPQAQFARLHGAQRQHAHHQRLGNGGQVIPGMLIGQGRVVLDGQAAIGAAVQHAARPGPPAGRRRETHPSPAPGRLPRPQAKNWGCYASARLPCASLDQ